MRLLFVVALFGSTLLGCYPKPPVDQLAARAAFDLSCSPAEVRVVPLSGEAYGVTGCEKRATYLWVLKNPRYPGEGGQWVMNSSAQSAQNSGPRASEN